MRCIAETYTSLCCKFHISFPSFSWNMQSANWVASQEMLWIKSCLYHLSHLTTLHICKTRLLCVSMPKEQTLPNQSGKTYFSGRQETKKKKSCWRAQELLSSNCTCVQRDHLVSNQRTSCYQETTCILSCCGQYPRTATKPAADRMAAGPIGQIHLHSFEQDPAETEAK